MSKFAAIVLSAGTGARMKSDVPKQYLPLCEKPVIYYSLKAFEDSPVDEIILVAGPADIEYCRSEIVEKYNFHKVQAIVPGGKERYDSVFEGIKAVEHADYIMIHDGARPLLTQQIIRKSMEAVQTEQACVAGMPVKDTIKVIDSDYYAVDTPKRSSLWMVQTPQSFSLDLIRSAYARLQEKQENGECIPAITDDAMLIEQMLGRKVKLIEGSYRNIKVTTPEDLLTAENFLRNFENIG